MDVIIIEQKIILFCVLNKCKLRGDNNSEQLYVVYNAFLLYCVKYVGQYSFECYIIGSN